VVDGAGTEHFEYCVNRWPERSIEGVSMAYIWEKDGANTSPAKGRFEWLGLCLHHSQLAAFGCQGKDPGKGISSKRRLRPTWIFDRNINLAKITISCKNNEENFYKNIMRK
jgi:hypothetical protein